MSSGSGTLGKRAVAYVVPYGQHDRIPASVARLPVVMAMEKLSPSDFSLGTVVILGPGTALFHPLLASARAPHSGRPRARASWGPPDYGCPDQYFCLYDVDNWQGDLFQFSGPFFNGTGWWRLSDWGFGDRANSMRNRRGYDGLLNRNWPPNGAQYCADSHSSDSDFSNNFGGNGDNEASAIANVPDDIHC